MTAPESETPPVPAGGESEKKEGQTMTISHKVSGPDGLCQQARAVRDAYLLPRGVTVSAVPGGGIMTAPAVQPLTLAQRIRIFRKARGMSARVLAEKAGAGITRAVIANVECGKQGHVRSDQAVALSDALGVPLDVLLRGSDDGVLRRYFVEAVAS